MTSDVMIITIKAVSIITSTSIVITITDTGSNGSSPHLITIAQFGN
jgi:hypothetical protein